MANRMELFVVVKKDENDKDEKGFWHKVGVMFEHKDGKGWSIHLDALPVNGDLVARVPMPRDENKSATQGGGGGKGDGGGSEPPPITDVDVPF